MGSADANLLVAYANPIDTLHQRARAHMGRVGPLRATLPAMLEVLHVLGKGGANLVQVVGALDGPFLLEDIEKLFAVARTLDEGLVKTAFDAYHLVEASRAGGALHTADRELRASAYPTVPF